RYVPAGLGDAVGQPRLGRLCHRAGIERRDLALLGVGCAHEPCRVRVRADPQRVAVDTVSFEPGAVLVEVPPHGTDQCGPQPELAEAERDIGGDAAAPYDEVVD